MHICVHTYIFVYTYIYTHTYIQINLFFVDVSVLKLPLALLHAASL